MKQWFNTKFGLAPYREVQLVEFSYSNVENQEENSVTQYNLLLNEEVIQAHLEFEKRKGTIVMTIGSNPEQLLRKEGFDYEMISKKIIPYEMVLEKNYQFQNWKML